MIDNKEHIGELTALDSDTHIRFGLFYAWGKVVSNIPLSILFAYFFPIVLLMTYFFFYKQYKFNIGKKIVDFMKISCYYMLVSFIYVACLYQDNGHEKDMNFRNAWIVSFLLIYILSMVVLEELNSKCSNKNERMLICVNKACVLVHIMFGVALFSKNLF